MKNTLPKFYLFLLITLALTTCSTNDDNIEEVNNEELKGNLQDCVEELELIEAEECIQLIQTAFKKLALH
ncbi:hypothetical protein [Oceanihabitans sediminis]|uniref:Uncharacterized protein n=1 Tax=Oceanihabitans sediminis TaxID=1812012 RepID=A0A368P8U4_9FLAO|nr:hypothetical protein [Oceanihabitans sediminis]MDX1277651.1 hypothetical protein [Oceanihabitans sediminis]RBP32079.1 hypothetical protein DFR65_103116 [Oceanihabitans sediminis]RCU58730.1 hypothetical protein DU428_05005 [Oceanihabitans sediminis]